MTNMERIQKLSPEQFVTFLKYCNFTGFLPVIEGKQFYNEAEVVKWLNEEEKDVRVYYADQKS